MGTTGPFKADNFVCYCFKFTKTDIEKDFMANGQSLIYQKIAFQKKSGHCSCATQNPKGR